MDKYMKMENTQKIFTSGFPSLQISYFLKGLILDKEELILGMEEEILFSKIKERFVNHFL